MSSIINATTTNGLKLQPDNSGSLVLQTNNGTTALTIDTSQNATFAGTLTGTSFTGSGSGITGVIKSSTAVASTSGTSITFTGIPSWVKRITVMYSSLSTNGSSSTQVQLGTSGGLTTSGYLSGYVYSGGSTGGGNLTTGLFVSSTSPADTRHGTVTITNITGNTWVSTTVNGQSNNNYAQFGGGSIALSGALTQLAINMANGTDVFDSGTINILYE